VTGTLFIVATPIGNLEDITYRAVRILKEADLIACEDTRHTRRLLSHFGIETPSISYHEHNENERAEDLLNRLNSGRNVALVSDAGTPLISDPGYRIVQRAAAASIRISPVPGPVALIAALSASGLPTDSFYFGGFLPSKPLQRRKSLEAASEFECTVIFYEAPHRIRQALEDVRAIFGDTKIVLTRELTKLHEEFIRGSAATVLTELQSRPEVRGELTLLIGKHRATPEHEGSIPAAVETYVASGLSRMEAIKAVARDRGVSKREIYAAMEESGS
jgi:16S rRNA (cytidine1402-2'-O)-methyltransferase